MRPEDLDFLNPREERVQWNGREIIVREMTTAANRSPFVERDHYELKFLIACCYEADGKPVFQPDDLQRLVSSPLLKVEPLLGAMRRVMGLDPGEEVKNSGAGPSAG